MYMGWVESWGYAGVVVLMALESSIFPVPSEIVIPPAAIMAASGGRMTLPGVILAGTFGSWLGAAITYRLALELTRLVLLRDGRGLLISVDKLARAERFVRRYEAGGIFFARLLPVIRHLISIPAGLVRMSFVKFSLLTAAGSAVWCSVLAWLGGRVSGELRARGSSPLDPDALMAAVQRESHLVVGAVLLLCVLYFVALKLTEPKASA
jgi:membrane protein DedA with SNARE-associated domain